MSAVSHAAPTETSEEWIALGKRIHGGFGSYIALGIRIGLDARQKLNAGPRELDVTYIDGESAPCACVADGLLISTDATPGQNSLRILNHKTSSAFGIALIRHKKTLRAVRYVIPISARPFLDAANTKPERERFDSITAAPAASLFRTEIEPLSTATFSVPAAIQR